MPNWSEKKIARYTVRPREHRAFHTALDAADLFTSRELVVVTWEREGNEGSLAVQVPVASGEFDERCAFAISPLRPTRFERTLKNKDSTTLRREEADFDSVVPKLPGKADR